MLLRGRASYKQNIGLIIASFKAALRSARIIVSNKKDPSVKFELKPNENVRCSLSLSLKMSPIMAGLPVMKEFGGSSVVVPPLKIDLTSEI